MVTALEAMALGEVGWCDGSVPGETLQLTREEDPEGPWWDVEVLDEGGSVSRRVACSTPGEVESLARGLLVLCPDCAGMIGGACSGPDLAWRLSLPGEICQAEDH